MDSHFMKENNNWSKIRLDQTNPAERSVQISKDHSQDHQSSVWQTTRQIWGPRRWLWTVTCGTTRQFHGNSWKYLSTIYQQHQRQYTSPNSSSPTDSFSISMIKSTSTEFSRVHTLQESWRSGIYYWDQCNELQCEHLVLWWTQPSLGLVSQ